MTLLPPFYVIPWLPQLERAVGALIPIPEDEDIEDVFCRVEDERREFEWDVSLEIEQREQDAEDVRLKIHRAPVVRNTKPSHRMSTGVTGDKTQFSDLVHCKYTVRTWTMYLPNTHPVHHRYIQNFPSQFPGSFPGAANVQYIHSVPGCVIKMS